MGGYEVLDAEIGTIALLANPAAGKGGAAEAAQRARAQFRKRGIDVVVLQGASPEASRKLAREAVHDPRCDALVVCGGDGLINLAIQEQAEASMPIGIIPAGSGNDLARVLGISNDPEAAADLVADGVHASMDLGRIRTSGEGESHTHWFSTVACAGFDAKVSERALTLRWPRGGARYAAATAIELLRLRGMPARLTLDDGTVYTDPVTVVSIGNTSTYGGGMRICPEANHRDGLLDLTVMADIPRRRILGNFARVYRGSFLGAEGLLSLRARSVHVEIPDQAITVFADGDPIAPLPATIEVVRGAGRFFVPRAEATRAREATAE